MNYGPRACQRAYDFVNELENGILRDKGLTNSNINKIPISPHLCIIINNISCWSLLDSGSQVTAISEEFYNKLKSQNNKMLEMPVSNVLVSTAIGKKVQWLKNK